MKNKFIIFIFFTCFSSLLFAADPVEPQSVTLYNRTGYSLSHIFVTTGQAGYWGPDILGEGAKLENGEMKGILLHVPTTDTGFHFMAVDEEGYRYMIYNAEFPRGEYRSVVFRFNHFLETAPELNFINIRVINRSVPLYRLYVTPAESDSCGVDLLYGERILETEESLKLLLPAQRKAVPYRIYAVDEDLDDYLVSIDLGLERPDAEDTITVSIETADQHF